MTYENNINMFLFAFGIFCYFNGFLFRYFNNQFFILFIVSLKVILHTDRISIAVINIVINDVIDTNYNYLFISYKSNLFTQIIIQIIILIYKSK